MTGKSKIVAMTFTFTGLILFLLMVGIYIQSIFHFQPTPKKLTMPTLEIINKKGNLNSLPQWCNARDNIGLIFAADVPKKPPVVSRQDGGISVSFPVGLVLVDPFQKKLVRVDKNIFYEEMGDTQHISIADTQFYGGISLPYGVLAYEKAFEKNIGFNVFYKQDGSGGLLNKYMPWRIFSVDHQKPFPKSNLRIQPVSGGGGNNLFLPGANDTTPVVEPVRAGQVYNCDRANNLYYSTKKLDSSLTPLDMQDLWSLNMNNGDVRKLDEEVYSPKAGFSQGVIYLKRPGTGEFSLHTAGSFEGTVEYTRFQYHAERDELPALDLLRAADGTLMEICFTTRDAQGNTEIKGYNPTTRSTRTIVKKDGITGPIISSASEINNNEVSKLLYFTNTNGQIKAYVCDYTGKIFSEIYSLLQSTADTIVEVEEKPGT